jgi:hypothetical protein
MWEPSSTYTPVRSRLSGSKNYILSYFVITIFKNWMHPEKKDKSNLTNNKNVCITDNGSKQMKNLLTTSGLLYLSWYNNRSYVSEHILDKTQTLASDAFDEHTVNNFSTTIITYHPGLVHQASSPSCPSSGRICRSTQSPTAQIKKKNFSATFQ